MSHSEIATNANPETTYQVKKKLYMNVFWALLGLTVVELVLTLIPHKDQPIKGIITALIIGFSCSKAVLVAYYFMHLNHEKMWTRVVAASPLGILLYAIVLMVDTPSRPVSVYIGEAPRFVYMFRSAEEREKMHKKEEMHKEMLEAGMIDEDGNEVERPEKQELETADKAESGAGSVVNFHQDPPKGGGAAAVEAKEAAAPAQAGLPHIDGEEEWK